MKRIYLMRHAKSSWKEPLPDHERPLKKRGKKAAKRMGKYLRNRGLVPEWILSSDAVRARQTAVLLAEGLGLSSDRIRIEPALYEAEAPKILRIIRELDLEGSSVLLVAHNPGISNAAVELSGDRRFGWLPTAAIVGIDFDVETWKKVGGKSGSVCCFATPKSIGEA